VQNIILSSHFGPTLKSVFVLKAKNQCLCCDTQEILVFFSVAWQKVKKAVKAAVFISERKYLKASSMPK